MTTNHNAKCRYISWLLAVILIFNSTAHLAIARISAEEPTMYEGDSLNGWQLDAFWMNGSKSLTIHSSTDETIDVKLTISYYAPISAMTRTYPAGSVKFVVPDIGTVKRSGAAFIPMTVAENADSVWDCEYDVETQSYIFTNNTAFESDKPLSGGFEMMWQLKSRECINDFSLIQNPVFLLENEGTKMTPLEFHCNTDRDFYHIVLSRNYLSYLDFIDEDINKNDYISFEYNTKFQRQSHARASELNTYFVKISFEDESVTEEEMSKIIIQTGSGDDRKETFLTQIEDPAHPGEMVWGFYCFIDKESGNLPDDSFILSFPGALERKNAIVDTYLSVHYLDDEENEYVNYHTQISGEELHSQVNQPVNKYAFQYGNGSFSMNKFNDYETYSNPYDRLNEGEPPAYANRLLSKKIYSGETVTFTIAGNYSAKHSTSTSASSLNLPEPGDIHEDDGVDLTSTFDFILGDDRLSIVRTDGDFRMLTADEYTIKRLLVPVDGYGYNYDVYVSNVGYNNTNQSVANHRPGQDDYRLFDSGNTNTEKLFDFSSISSKSGFADYNDGVKAFYIVVHGVKADRRYYTVCQPDISFHFSAETTDIDTDSDQAKITNIGFMRALRTGTDKNLCATKIENFLFDFGGKIMYMDAISYNDGFAEAYGHDGFDIEQYEMLYHSMSSVYLRDLTTSLTSGTIVSSEARTKENGGGYQIEITSSGSIIAEKNADEETPGELTKFSLYTKIPSLLTINKNLSGITLMGCNAKDTFGNSVSNADFANNVTYRLMTLSNGDKVVAADFDFTDTPLEISSMTNMSLHIPAEILYTDFKTASQKNFTVYSYTMLRDSGIGKIVAKNNPAVDSDDFNRNGSTNEIMASSSAGKNYDNIVEEWEDTTEKFVKSYLDDTWRYEYDSTRREWCSETNVNAYSPLIDAEANQRATYAYRLSFDTGSASSDIVFFDKLETAEDSEWNGTLNSIDLTYAISLGLTPYIYYSTEDKNYTETLIDDTFANYTNNLDEFTAAQDTQWNGSIWNAPVNIRSVVVKFDTSSVSGKIIQNRQVYFMMNMTAPEDMGRELLGKSAMNEHTVSYTVHNSLSNSRRSLTSRATKVTLFPAVLLVTLQKTDAQTGNVLTSAKFAFYTDKDGTQPVIDWQNQVTANDIEINSLGEVTVNTLEPGTYYFKEIEAPPGYQLDKTVYMLDLNGTADSPASDQTYINNATLKVNDRRLYGKIILTKKDADDSDIQGIQGAEYALYDASGIRVYTDENNVYQATDGTKSVFTSDANGKVIITGLPWGTYYLSEQKAPKGYDLNPERIRVTIGRNVNLEEQATENAIVVYCEQTDIEQLASVKLTKYDRNGITPLANAWFALERKNRDGSFSTVNGYEFIKTGKNGIVTAEDLKFGTYRFKEVNAPNGYVLDEEKRYSDEIVLDASTVGTVQGITMTNERILGSATLRKYSDDGLPLNGAVFDLYMVNGEIDGSEAAVAAGNDPADLPIKLGLRTATDTQTGDVGMLPVVTGLDWGKYYFKEFSSPNGYELDKEIYAFEITANNAAVIADRFQPVNTRKKGEVILTKTAGERVGEKAAGEPLAGAVFVLYRSDGELLSVKPDNSTSPTYYTLCDKTDTEAITEMTTNTLGQINIKGIDWGGYYLEEKQAPSGFALAEKVRFSVNALSCLAVQELECEDMAMTCLIKIDKAIDNKLDVFGTPTFLFKVVNTDTNEDFTCTITLKGDFLEGTAAVQVPAGHYKIEEIPVNRYQLIRTEYITDKTSATNLKIDGEEVTSKNGGKVFTFELGSDEGVPQQAEVKFTNELVNYSGLSHNSAVLNIIPSKRKITGFSLVMKDEYIECLRTENADPLHEITIDDLDGVITYDDGTTESMTVEEMAQIIPTSWQIDNGFINAGQSFAFNASYTKENKTYKTSFIATVGPYKVIESQKVIFRNDTENASVFSINGKQSAVNVVYYNNDENDIKIAVSGEYISPVMLKDSSAFVNWQIVGGDDDGMLLSPNEGAVKEYLAEHYDDGLRELELRVVLGSYVYNFEPKNEVQEFVAPKDGIYFLEGWGAQGGNNGIDNFDDVEFTEEYLNIAGLRSDIQEHYSVGGGKGGYSYGYVYLTKGQTVYIAVGGKGETAYNVNNEYIKTSAAGGWNGGGDGYAPDKVTVNATPRDFGGSGGGATHFAINQNLGELKDYSSSKNDVLLVAGGGGGSAQYSYITNHEWNQYGLGGYGGGEVGGAVTNKNHDKSNKSDSALGGNQSGGGSGIFGAGSRGNESFGGGGGGWYGGTSDSNFGATGGSGHVNDSALITGATIGGNQSFMSPSGTMETGHTGDGYARITYIDNGEFNLGYSGKVQQFTAPISGYYKLEGWGAAGGSSKKIPESKPSSQEDVDKFETAEGGRGGYSSGYVYLEQGQTIFYAVGGMGNTFADNDVSILNSEGGYVSGGFNGGGAATGLYYNNYTKVIQNNGSGGGATHFALNSVGTGKLSAYYSNKDKVILVAGGGGGSGGTFNFTDQAWYRMSYGGNGGGLEGGSSHDYVFGQASALNLAFGGTQTAGGSVTGYDGHTADAQQVIGGFGYGGGGDSSNIGTALTGGGGGWYGGGSGRFAAGGGSSYIGNAKLISGQTIAGNTIDYTTSDGTVMKPENMPTHPGAIVDNGIVGVDSEDTQMIGNRGDGYARITYIPYTEPIDYSYSGKAQSFTAPVTGYYTLEAWGAQGGNANQTDNDIIGFIDGGKGGYSYGTVYLTEGQTVYLAVGGKGTDVVYRVNNVTQTPAQNQNQSGGFNGGGNAYAGGSDPYKYAGGGGGATHFALSLDGNGKLSDYSSDTDKVLLVAGGGGGSYYCSGSTWMFAAYGGFGGGENGGNGKVIGSKNANFIGKEIPGGTQEQQTNTGNYNYGTFGQGTNASNTVQDAGGGGGWYGGGKGISVDKGMSGGGGSGHCNEDELLASYGFDTIGGDTRFTAPDGTMETGHTGNGFARVSFAGSPDSQEFDYTGSVQTFRVSKTGQYLFEAWGASGGDGLTDGKPYQTFGKGAYTKGTINLTEGMEIYVYIGGKGTDAEEKKTSPGGWNGGGQGFPDGDNDPGGGGGGATDFRLVKSTSQDGWSGFDSLKSRIMVAGAGGGASWATNWGDWVKPVAGAGGTLNGLDGCTGKGGSQNGSIGYFGKGKDGNDNPGGTKQANGDGIAGSGSGYYGGDIDYSSNGLQNAGGGSSFISGYEGCDAISAESTENNIIHTGQSNHYSGMVFKNAVMIDGSSEMPTHDGTGTMTGNIGNGHAKITYLG